MKSMGWVCVHARTPRGRRRIAGCRCMCRPDRLDRGIEGTPRCPMDRIRQPQDGDEIRVGIGQPACRVQPADLRARPEQAEYPLEPVDLCQDGCPSRPLHPRGRAGRTVASAPKARPRQVSSGGSAPALWPARQAAVVTIRKRRRVGRMLMPAGCRPRAAPSLTDVKSCAGRVRRGHQRPDIPDEQPEGHDPQERRGQDGRWPGRGRQCLGPRAQDRGGGGPAGRPLSSGGRRRAANRNVRRSHGSSPQSSCRQPRRFPGRATPAVSGITPKRAIPNARIPMPSMAKPR